MIDFDELDSKIEQTFSPDGKVRSRPNNLLLDISKYRDDPNRFKPKEEYNKSDLKIENQFYDDYTNYKRTGDTRYLNSLLRKLGPTIDLAIKSYTRSGANLSTRLEAQKIIINNLNKYDPKHSPLKNFVLSQLRGLYRKTESKPMTVHVPEQWLLDNRKIRIAEQELISELGRQPSDAEIADRLKIPISRVTKARKVPAINPDTAFVESQSLDTGKEIKLNPETIKVWVQTIYAESDPKDQVILEHTLEHPFDIFGKPKLSDKELAQKLNISISNISQRKARLQKRLNEIFNVFEG